MGAWHEQIRNLTRVKEKLQRRDRMRELGKPITNWPPAPREPQPCPPRPSQEDRSNENDK